MKRAIPEIQLLSAESYEPQPWKNGKGETREIARGDGEPFPWRVSWALVPESGPFSPFPGYDRSLTVLSGGPVALSHDGKTPRVLALHTPHSFKGESETSAKVSSPSEDFNLFTLREKARGAVYPALLTPGAELQFAVQRWEHFLFCVRGRIKVYDPNGDRTFLLEEKSALRISRTEEVEYLNLRATADDDSAIGLWAVIARV